MPSTPYRWRTLTPEQKLELTFHRRQKNRPWHSPPHRPNFDLYSFHITAACYQHMPHIGLNPERMDSFSQDLLKACTPHIEKLFAWCLLPNHYHLLVKAPDLRPLLTELGRLHGRTSYLWNREEQTRGRQVFYRSTDRAIRSGRHYFATLNYIHHNPIHHHYTTRWQDWPWSSATEYLELTGNTQATHIWKTYPILNYGQGWDDPNL